MMFHSPCLASMSVAQVSGIPLLKRAHHISSSTYLQHPDKTQGH